jgi:hypothetical protein
MKRIFKNELVLLLLIILVFISLRSVYFTEHLNFSADQAEQSTDVLQFYREHKIPLIGNPVNSTVYQGHFLYQGPGYYYMLFPFLLVTNFDPVHSSYLFMLFCALMVIPLYYGMKLLINKNTAWLMVIIYSLLPYYVNYTRFHWNPNYQLSLLPLLILFMGFYKKYKSQKLFFLISIFLGFLFQFHYQFIFVILGLAVYYFLIKKVSPLLLIHFFIGLAIGILPLLLFEIKHDFYNIRTLILLITHHNEVVSAGSITTPHYYLSLSFMLLVAVLAIVRNKLPKGRTFFYVSSALAVVLFAWSALLNFQKPATAYWSYAKNWTYPDTEKVYQIIQSQHLKDYNVADLTYYNTKASTIKFLLKRDNVDINYEDYYQNKYLFVEKASKTNVYDTLSYEVAGFRPAKLLHTWKINNYYNLYLLKRS